MNPTYLKHPVHGAHIVYDHGALDRCLKGGWVLDENQPDGGQKPEPKVARVVGADTDGDGKIDQVFGEKKEPEPAVAPAKKKGGRPKKAK